MKNGKVCPECGFDQNETDRYYCRQCGSYIKNIQLEKESNRKKSYEAIKIVPDSIDISSQRKPSVTNPVEIPSQKREPVQPVKKIPRNAWRFPKIPTLTFGSLRKAIVAGIIILLIIILGIFIISFAGALFTGPNSSGNKTSVSTAIPFSGTIFTGSSSHGNSTSPLATTPIAGTTNTGSPFSNSGNPVIIDNSVPVKNPSSGSSSGTQIHIVYAGSWSGLYTDDGTTSRISGSGERTITLKNPGPVITGSFTKGEQNSDKMVIEITHDGNIVKMGSTTIPFGTVTISSG